MSFKFSERSKKELATCHYDLQRLAEALILKVDFAVLKGERGEAEQNKAFDEGFSNFATLCRNTIANHLSRLIWRRRRSIGRTRSGSSTSARS